MANVRYGGDWPPDLEGLRESPAMMLLAAVVWRAKQDARKSPAARRFLLRVQRLCRAGGDAGYAVVRAIREG